MGSGTELVGEAALAVGRWLAHTVAYDRGVRWWVAAAIRRRRKELWGEGAGAMWKGSQRMVIGGA